MLPAPPRFPSLLAGEGGSPQANRMRGAQCEILILKSYSLLRAQHIVEAMMYLQTAASPGPGEGLCWLFDFPADSTQPEPRHAPVPIFSADSP